MEAASHILRKKTALAASGRFKGFRPESEHTIRQPAPVAKDRKLEAMIEEWGRLHSPIGRYHDYTLGDMRRFGVSAWPASDIERFSLIMGQFESEERFPQKAGVFLNILMSASSDTRFVIHTAHLSQRIDFLGDYNSKEIVVKGDAGKDLGVRMKRGTIILLGDAGDNAGFEMKTGNILIIGNAASLVGNKMYGGFVYVQGDSGDKAGNCMLGGKLVVGGNAGAEIACYMHKGEIHIGGECGGLGYLVEHGILMARQKIYQGRVRIFPQTTLLEEIVEGLIPWR